MTRDEFIKGLRNVADFFEKHPELPIPFWFNGSVGLYGQENQREVLSRFAKALGHTRKSFTNEAMLLHHNFAGEGTYCVSLQVHADRDAVCRKIVTKKVLPPQPEKVLPAMPEREVEEVTWECDEPILATV